MFINDVGQNTWEEINDGVAGANYGWPDTEGPTTESAHSSRRATPTTRLGTPCAITGGAFYAPQTAQFPADYVNDYFFADYCGGWIRKLDPAHGNTVTNFATGIASPVDLKVGDDGSLYYLARGGGATGVVYRITYSASLPSITQHPASRTVAPGHVGRRSASAPPARRRSRYQWQRNGVNICGRHGQDYTLGRGRRRQRRAASAPIVTNANGSVHEQRGRR